MSKFWSFILVILFITSLITLGFVVFQVYEEKKSLSEDLEYRTKVLAEGFYESIEPRVVSRDIETLQKLIDKFTGKHNFVGIAVFDQNRDILVSSKDLSDEIINKQLVSQLMTSGNSMGNYNLIGKTRFYNFTELVYQNESVVGAFTIYQNVNYIDSSLVRIWKVNFWRTLIQAFLMILVVSIVLRWLIYKPILTIVRSIQKIKSGNADEELKTIKHFPFLKSISSEISKVSASLTNARSAASEEAKMRLEKLDTPWTEKRLEEFVKANLKDRKIFLISNREPYVHKHIKNKINWMIPAGGAVTALESLMQACRGMWIASATGDADRETADKNGKLQVPPDDPKYTLKRIWLSEQEQKGFYVGFSNEALWPLCHNVHNRPIFRKEDWQEYKRVNGKFAQNLLAEIKNVEHPLILVQDYHFALFPQMIKKSRPDAQIGMFWHIPWPSPEIFGICPWSKEILTGMLGAEMIGFHTKQYCNNFMNTVGKEIESIIDSERPSITLRGHSTHVSPFPISIAFTNGKKDDPFSEKGKEMLEQFGVKTEYVGFGVDRLDYTKGIKERFKGVELFFDSYPNYKEKFTFLQIAAPSREEVEKYKQFNEEITAEAERINQKLSQNNWKPIVLIKRHLSHQELYPLYRQANVCLITPLHDGMNLVCKEFVAARDDERGVLILSKFAGAARDLKGAIIINPYSAEETASAINEGLNMTLVQQRRRMKKMRQAVKNYNVYRWSADFLKTIIDLE